MGLNVVRDCFSLEEENTLFLLNEKTPAKFSFKSMWCSSDHWIFKIIFYLAQFFTKMKKIFFTGQSESVLPAIDWASMVVHGWDWGTFAWGSVKIGSWESGIKLFEVSVEFHPENSDGT